MKQISAEEFLDKHGYTDRPIPKWVDTDGRSDCVNVTMMNQIMEQYAAMKSKQAASEAWDDGFYTGFSYDDADAPTQYQSKQQFMKRYES